MSRTAMLLAISATLLVPGASSAATPKSCPSPKTCRAYAVDGSRWPAKRGVVDISIVVYPGRQTWFPDDAAVVDAVKAAAATWTAADSNVRFHVRRAGDVPCASAAAAAPVACDPALPGHGDNVDEIYWADYGTGAVDTVASSYYTISHGLVQEADIALNRLVPWSWQRCGGKNGPCAAGAPAGGLVATYDLQAVVTHELGHWLRLQHVAGAATEQTMYPTIHQGERKKSTLAIGDVLGVRAKYPCARCPMPAIEVP